MNQTPQLIGLNLVDCIRDLVTGSIHPAQVVKLYIGEICSTPREWEETLTRYLRIYWKNLPEDQVRQVFTDLQQRALIFQPPPRNPKRCPVVQHGQTRVVWVEQEDQIVWW